MKAHDVIGYVRDDAAFCEYCTSSGEPIFADTEEAFVCADCGEVFGASDEAMKLVFPDNLTVMEESLEAPSADVQQQRRVRR